MEIWKPIKDFEGMYEVSNTGFVKSLGTGSRKLSPRVLSGRLGGKRRYPNVQLKKEGFVRYEYVHRLVAEAFIPNPLNLPEINHIDRDKSNNNVANLEWVSPQRNTEHSHSKRYLLATEEGELEVFNLRKYCRDNGLDRNRVKKLIVRIIT